MPEMARMNEKNGRHVFHGIYQDCYILQKLSDINLNKSLSDEEYECLRAAMEVARDGCVRANNTDNHYFWRVR